MKRSMIQWTTGAAAAALLALPASVLAQTSGTASQPPTTTTTQTQSPTDSAAAREHLRKARAALAEVRAADLDTEARVQLQELTKHLAALERITTAQGQGGQREVDTELEGVDRVFITLLGPAGTTKAGAAGTAGATGTTGTAGTANQGMTLNEATRSKLGEARTHIIAFTMAVPRSAVQGAAATAPEPGMTHQHTGTAGQTGATPQTADPQMQAPGAQVDEEAARRHLTEARNTLSALTQLPAATQLTGEARAHVSQLITNFNELITTPVNWRASYAKVEANLSALLGPDTTAGAGVTGTTGTTGTTGATAGTSGAAGVELDPAVREKLVELRRDLKEFEKAAGGMQAGGADPAATTPHATGTTPPPTGTTGTTGMTATDPQQPGAQPAPAGNADIARHVAAIERLLKMQDDSGGLTLTKAQAEELRMHWNALRQAVEKR